MSRRRRERINSCLERDSNSTTRWCRPENDPMGANLEKLFTIVAGGRLFLYTVVKFLNTGR